MSFYRVVNCHIKCDWQWFWPNYVRLSLPQYLRLGEKDSGNRLIGIPYRLAMIGQWARLFTQLTTFLTMTCFGESNGSAALVTTRAFRATPNRMFAWRSFPPAKRIR